MKQDIRSNHSINASQSCFFFLIYIIFKKDKRYPTITSHSSLKTENDDHPKLGLSEPQKKLLINIELEHNKN